MLNYNYHEEECARNRNGNGLKFNLLTVTYALEREIQKACALQWIDPNMTAHDIIIGNRYMFNLDTALYAIQWCFKTRVINVFST
jgi:hypothetical protein